MGAPCYNKIHSQGRRCGEIGRRKGLKIPRWQHHAGSSPASGTKTAALPQKGGAAVFASAAIGLEPRKILLGPSNPGRYFPILFRYDRGRNGWKNIQNGVAGPRNCGGDHGNEFGAYGPAPECRKSWCPSAPAYLMYRASSSHAGVSTPDFRFRLQKSS